MLDLNLMGCPVVLGHPRWFWTPNYNGINSYIEIPQTYYKEISFNLYVPYPQPLHTKLIDSTINRLDLKISGLTIEHERNDLVVTVNGSSNTTVEAGTVNHVRVTSENFIFVSTIGKSALSDSLYLQGQISNLHLIGLDNFANSRFYKSIIQSEEMPTTTTLKDSLGDGNTDGKLVNFGTDQPWVPKRGDREHFAGDRTGVNWVNGVDTHSKYVTS